MDDKEWRTRLDAARERLAAVFQEEIAARIETEMLYALHGAERDHVRICRSLLDGLDVAHQRLLVDPQAGKPSDTSQVAFQVLLAEARGEDWRDTGLEKARSERDAAREAAGGANLEFLVRMWLEWRLKARSAP